MSRATGAKGPIVAYLHRPMHIEAETQRHRDRHRKTGRHTDTQTRREAESHRATEAMCTGRTLYVGSAPMAKVASAIMRTDSSTAFLRPQRSPT